MPQNKYALARYQIIDNLLRKNKYVKTDAIVKTCQERLGFHVSQRTIQLDIISLKSDQFLNYFAPIAYCPKRKAFFYEDLNYQLSPFGFSQEEYSFIHSILENHKEDVSCEYSDIFRSVKFKTEMNMSK